MPLNKGSPFRSSLLAALDTALPLQHRPTWKVMLRQLGKYRPKIHLSISQRPEPPRSIHPGLITPINALPPARTKLRILHVKHFDSLVVQIDEFQIIKLLQHEMARIEKYMASRMIPHALQKHFKRRPIMQVLAGMNLKAQIHSRLIECIQNGMPSSRQFIKSRLN